MFPLKDRVTLFCNRYGLKQKELAEAQGKAEGTISKERKRLKAELLAAAVQPPETLMRRYADFLGKQAGIQLSHLLGPNVSTPRTRIETFSYHQNGLMTFVRYFASEKTPASGLLIIPELLPYLSASNEISFRIQPLWAE